MMKNETWQVALDALLSNKIKTALTMLGVTIGTTCIVMVVTVSMISKNYVMAQIEAVGTDLVYAYFPGNHVNRYVGDEISLDDLTAARTLPHVVETAGAHDIGNNNIIVNGEVKPATLVGVTEGFQKIRNLLILEGRFFDHLDMQSNAKACLITQDLAKAFKRDMLGQVIRVGNLRFTVIGVFRERVATFGQSEITQESVLVPFALLKYYQGIDYVRTLYAQADSHENVALVTAELHVMLQSRHRQGAAYTVENLAGILEAAHQIALALTLVLLLVSCIVLLTSGVSIMNIMLVTVTERTREIGLRKAVGANRSDILLQFLTEAVLISGLGAVLGIIIAVSIKLVAEPLVPAEYNIHIPISMASIVVAFAVSCSTGVLFGYLPASRASRLQPTEALHHE
ncbi:MAG TPA: ABC transporter permease [Candidatus Saccharimonadales bacterium]|jgi:putative ABC transport system permease protein|nr:ABC transporter permease [Candidatus Saccharimonadales bacterium]